MKNFKYLAAIGLIGIMSTFLMACGKTDSAGNGSNSHAVSDKASSNVNEIDTQTKNCIELSKIALPDIATESDFISYWSDEEKSMMSIDIGAPYTKETKGKYNYHQYRKKIGDSGETYAWKGLDTCEFNDTEAEAATIILSINKKEIDCTAEENFKYAVGAYKSSSDFGWIEDTIDGSNRDNSVKINDITVDSSKITNINGYECNEFIGTIKWTGNMGLEHETKALGYSFQLNGKPTLVMGYINKLTAPDSAGYPLGSYTGDDDYSVIRGIEYRMIESINIHKKEYK